MSTNDQKNDVNQNGIASETEDKKPCNWDQCITIKVSRDKLEAYMQIDKKCHENTVDIAILKEAVAKAKIMFGIDEEVLHNISINVPAFQGESLLIAKGFPSESAIDGYIEFVRDDLEPSKKAPLVLQDGKVDFYQVKDIPSVLRGEEIARKIPPVDGKSGKDVHGNEIIPKPGKDPRFPVGKNVVINKEETSIYALIDGQVSITERGKINVFSIYEVHGDVDFSTGNIDFVGSVVVNGNVLTGFSVKALGDIRIKGNIEGAYVEAKGTIEIAGGIIGYHKGHVIAKQNLKASFIQNGIVTVDNDVIVSDSIMHSKVSAGRNIILDGTKALIVGGVLRAGEEVSAKVIGNSMATPTEIEVGAHPALRTELMEIRAKLKEIAINFDKTEQAVLMLNKMKTLGKITEEKESMRIKLEDNFLAMKKYREEGSLRIQEIEGKLGEISQARIKANSIVYPGVKFLIGNETKFIREEVRRSIFFMKEKEITFMPTR